MKITAKAGAKINLTLDIVGIRDDGYHLVDMIMQSVSLYDTVIVETMEKGIKVASSDMTLGGEEDICYKSAVCFFKESGISGGAEITVKKNIPLAAGLGGGSADAAAVLLALNKCYGNPLDLSQLEKIGLSLGADVPFFLHGGTVSVTGIGEIFEKLPDIPKCKIVIAKNASKPSTKEMYRIIDSSVITDRPDTKMVKQAIFNSDLELMCKNLKNVFSVAWEQTDIVDIFKSTNALAVSLSGSGPSYFGIFDDIQKANSAIEQFSSRGITCFLAEPTESAIIFE